MPDRFARLRWFKVVSKLSDCIGENWETDTAIDFARDCGYISNEVYTQLTCLNPEAGKMLRSIQHHPKRFLTPNAQRLAPNR
jgi:four helix bundle protein